MSGDQPSKLLQCYQQVYDLVYAIPAGRVMTYGQLAALVGGACAGPVPAITVGRAMAASGTYAPDLPWWRVIGKAGDWGVLRSHAHGATQRDLLAREGVYDDGEGRYDLLKYQFWPAGESPGERE